MPFRELPWNEEIIKLFGNPNDSYFAGANLNNHNEFFQYVVNRRVAKDAVAFDIGANIGLTTTILSKFAPQGRIYSFEPNPEAMAYLQRLVSENGLNNVTALPLAISSQAGEIAFLENFVSASASHIADAGSLTGSRDGKKTVVSAVTIDAFVAEQGLGRLDLIKVDVEGFEMAVLEGAPETLSRLKPDWFIEFNSFTLIAYGDVNPRRLLERVVRTFPYVYWFADGQIKPIDSDEALLGFLHENLVHHGCVDDLYCSFTPLDP
jgi:FkbM family methyltransferase